MALLEPQHRQHHHHNNNNNNIHHKPAERIVTCHKATIVGSNTNPAKAWLLCTALAKQRSCRNLAQCSTVFPFTLSPYHPPLHKTPSHPPTHPTNPTHTHLHKITPNEH